MKKVILYIAQSIDGFIASPNGNIDWLNEDVEFSEQNDFGYSNFYDSVDTTLMGYNTYKEILGFDIPFPYLKTKNYVFSRNHTKKENLPVEFISSDIVRFVSDLKQNNGKDIWLIGGGEINKILLNNNLIDEIILTIKTVVLGNGISLFGSNNELNKFEVISSKTLDKSLIEIHLKRKNH